MSTHHSLSHFYLLSLPLCFLAPGTVTFPLGLPCHFEHHVAGVRCPPPSCPLPSEHQWGTRNGQEQQWGPHRWTEWENPSCSCLSTLPTLPQGLCSLVQCTETHVHPLAVPQTVQRSHWMLLSAGFCPSSPCCIGEHLVGMLFIWSRRCTFRAGDRDRTCICWKFPEILKFFSGSGFPALKLWVWHQILSHQRLTMGLFLHRQLVPWVAGALPSLCRAVLQNAQQSQTWVTHTVSVNRNICMGWTMQNKFSKVWGSVLQLYDRYKFRRIKCEHCKVLLLIKLLRNEKHCLIMKTSYLPEVHVGIVAIQGWWDTADFVFLKVGLILKLCTHKTSHPMSCDLHKVLSINS